MAFKDVIKNDLNAIFNINEFAEIHDIDGRQMPAVIDADLLKDRPRQPLDMYNATAGVYLEELVLFVRLSDIIERPVTSQTIHLDGKSYQVNYCTESEGILEIMLEAYQA